MLSSASHPLHAAVAAHSPQVHVAQAHETAQKTSSVPNPVLVNLTPTTSGITISDVSFDSRIDLITIKGTITINQANLAPPEYGYTPSYPTTDYLGVNATQAVNRTQSVSGSQYLNEPIANASVTKISFTSKILATAGEFKSGIVGITVTSSSYYVYSYSTLSVVAKMRNAKAY